MKNPRLESLANQFWAESQLAPRAPREIEKALALVLPVSLVKLPLLTMDTVRLWLRNRGIVVPIPPGPRDLMGCVIAHRGTAVIFVCGAAPEDELRFTVAHEIAHLLLHYFQPRKAVVAALGDQAVEVLDGERRATPRERAVAVLASVRLGPHVHLLPREGISALRVEVLEDEADRLALELVAPRTEVEGFLSLPEAFTMSPDEQCRRLGELFGVPSYLFTSAVQTRNYPRPISFVAGVRQILKGRQ